MRGINAYRVGQDRVCKYTVYGRTSGELPAKNTVYTPYIYRVLAYPIRRAR
jgi:hypothetical protein